MKQETQQTLFALKAQDQDFEWFPTTPEILRAINNDLLEISCEPYRQGRWHNSFEKMTTAYCHQEGREGSVFNIDKFLDVGTGDGRVFNAITGSGRTKIEIKHRLGIEKASAQADNLIRNGVGLIGRDLFETVLLGKFFNVVFCNPPYSEFDLWVEKILTEARSEVFYFVIPQRWANNSRLKEIMQNAGEVNVIGNFDFTGADRAARAVVDLVKVSPYKLRGAEKDPFDVWIENNIGRFEVSEDQIKEDEQKEADRKALQESRTDKAAVLCENYKEDLNQLMQLFQSLANVNFRLLKQLGLDKGNILKIVKDDIEALKKRYWNQAFNILEPISKRLTHKTRKKLLESIQWFADLDFNEGNIKTIIVWVVENYNKYVKEQVLQAFEDFTGFESVRAYKSNDKWFKSGWYYNNKEMPEKYSLEYRVICRCHLSSYQYDLQENKISDLAVVAANLGFDNTGVHEFEQDGKKYYCKNADGDVIFEYKLFKNDNAHIKMNQAFCKAFNLEVGRLKQWLNEPADAVREFDMSVEEAQEWFNRGNLQLIGKNSPLLLEFTGGNNV
jgi:hypothetical protein